MCSIIILNKVNKEFPLIIAANRDEVPSRKFTKPQLLSNAPIIIGGKDKLKGGTWLGINKQSLFATITNQNPTNYYKKTTRGQIVLDALKCQSIKELLSFVEDFDPKDYNDFNLVFGNNEVVYIAHSYLLHSMVIRELPQGINVITNDLKFTGTDNRKALIHDWLRDIHNSGWQHTYKELKSILASPDYGIKSCQRKNKETGKLSGKATTSSSILAFDNNGLARYKFYDRSKKTANGAHRYIDYIDLWRNPEIEFKEPSLNEEEQKEIIEEVDTNDFCHKTRQDLYAVDNIMKRLKKRMT
jgi:transport and Golgi organization protein 2